MSAFKPFENPGVFCKLYYLQYAGTKQTNSNVNRQAKDRIVKKKRLFIFKIASLEVKPGEV